MLVDSAVKIVNDGLTYRPGYEITAGDYTSRHESAIWLEIVIPTRQTERHEAPGYPTEVGARSRFMLLVDDCDGVEALMYKVLKAIAMSEMHEAREFLRLKPTFWAPFHPHKVEGTRRWARFLLRDRTEQLENDIIDIDLHYGVIG